MPYVKDADVVVVAADLTTRTGCALDVSLGECPLQLLGQSRHLVLIVHQDGD